MCEPVIITTKYSEKELPKIRTKEVWRYAGYPGIPGEEQSALLARLEEVERTLMPLLQYKVCYVRLPITQKEEKPILPFETDSRDLEKCLTGCDQVLLFAATLGLEVDRMIQRCRGGDMTRALLAQALGAERIEALCDTFCSELSELLQKESRESTPRFSPGYGDLSLTAQRDLFQLLDCTRKIGISLQDSCIMMPSKSVTAIVGIRPAAYRKSKVCQEAHHDQIKCKSCSKKDCQFRMREA